MKTIITLDKADSPYGFPQANEQGYLTSSKVSGPFGNNSVVSASYALTASFALNGGGGGTVDTSSLVTTASFNAFTASYNTGSFSGSFIGTFSGSLFGTASWAQSASVAISASTSDSASFAVSASWAPSPPFASVDQINTGALNGVFVRAQELEGSKHSTLNIFNYLNFT